MNARLEGKINQLEKEKENRESDYEKLDQIESRRNSEEISSEEILRNSLEQRRRIARNAEEMREKCGRNCGRNIIYRNTYR